MTISCESFACNKENVYAGRVLENASPSPHSSPFSARRMVFAFSKWHKTWNSSAEGAGGRSPMAGVRGGVPRFLFPLSRPVAGGPREYLSSYERKRTESSDEPQ